MLYDFTWIGHVCERGREKRQDYIILFFTFLIMESDRSIEKLLNVNCNEKQKAHVNKVQK